MMKASPTLPQNRIEQIDILRGFALFGILIVNSLGYNASFFNWNGFYTEHFTGTVESTVFNIIVNFCSDKFIFMFSLLFGFGFAMMYEKYKEDEHFFVKLYTKRLLVLLAFGILHIFFFWAGDILLLYALGGFILLATRKLKSSTLLTLSIICYFFGIFYIALQARFPVLPDAASSTANIDFSQVIATYRDGTIWETIKLRLDEYYSFRNINIFYYLPKILALFLFGHWCHRRHVLQRINSNPMKSLCIAAIIFAVGFLINTRTQDILAALISPFSKYNYAAYSAIFETNNILLGLSYAIAILALAKAPIFKYLLKPLKFAGRMALTNYILQSVIFTFIMYSWGLGRFATFSPSEMMILTLCVFGAELMFSVLWLRKYKYGPLEWLWRKLYTN
ncbi:MAG: DUF418 domain-containing protein [Bacteroidales bacterium]|nr:DUF418 domain-containing protein [Bacteroidales bacterium]